MGYQFIHLETYSRKADSAGRSTAFVFDEAERQPDACQHVVAPVPPTIVFGMSLSELRRVHDDRAAAAMTEAEGKIRRIRSDQHTLATVVASFPTPWEEVRADQRHVEALAEWERRTVAWLRDHYGEQLVSVQSHTDEKFPHLHAFILPSDPTMRAKALHAGWAAKSSAVSAAKAGGAAGKEANAIGDKAYKVAMRNWQDSYWQSVGLPCGLTRRGPGGRRLDRRQWKVEQAQAETAATLVREAKSARARTREAEAAVIRAKEAMRITKIQSAEMNKAARKLLTTARSQARRIVSEAEARAKVLRSVGGLVGSLWSGFRGVRERLERIADARVKAAHDLAMEELKAAKAAARAELHQRFGHEIESLRKARDELDRLAKRAEARATNAEATARSVKAELAVERSM